MSLAAEPAREPSGGQPALKVLKDAGLWPSGLSVPADISPEPHRRRSSADRLDTYWNRALANYGEAVEERTIAPHSQE